ncbi:MULTISPECIES: hypothetical protein [unclassified Paracoccus (in: a-proteobacteria)]|uniref:hypothetical protein n=1 Tax=unclassified Paracoccus (in: a-proteobacteria) TaxID=2688777 RepID=UPI0012B3AACD|nr:MULTISPECIES: hypothetical protein [unclassified Paracoccus (in: a-proteobacteria)]UXU74487.1 hypothetical protein GB879_011360 [Paracoccus sp. SMMA_5]UXU80380.1 hypothetical protein GB880_011340 [Paracoccus sp. SMMA_5_TC]
MSRFTPKAFTLAAMVALIAQPGLAQQSPQQPQPPAPVAASAINVPKALSDAGLAEITSKPAKRGDGMRIQGRLPDGTWIEAMVDGQGQLRGLRGKDDAALPAALVEPLVPQAVRSNALYAELGQIRAVASGPRGVMLAGQDAQGNKVHARFSVDGTLLRFGRSDGDDDHDKDHDDHPRGKHGKRGDDHGPRHRDRAADHPRGPAGPGGAGPGFEQVDAPTQKRLHDALTAAGYKDVGPVMRHGPLHLAPATNPEGEPVMLELNDQGQVQREINR